MNRRLLALSSCITLLTTGCAATPGLLSGVGSSGANLAALGAAAEARTIKTEIGMITMGLLPEKGGSAGRKEDETPLSIEESDGLIGGPEDVSIFKKGAGKLPAKADLREYFSPIRNQGALGSCSAFAMTGLMEAVWRIQKHKNAKTSVSPLFFYYAERKKMEEEGMAKATRKDTGAYMSMAAATAVRTGACPEAQVPYRDGKPGLAYDAKPEDFAAATPFKMKSKARLKTLDGMKSALAHKKPFILPIVLYQSFMTRTVARTGEMMMPMAGENIEGGHAVCAVGYDDAKGAFLVRNSWGNDWGQGGYFWMPYSYFKTRYVGNYYYGECFTVE